MASIFEKMKNSLSMTRTKLQSKVDLLFGYYESITEEFIEELEEVLILSDISYSTVQYIMDKLEEKIYETRCNNPDEVKPLLKEILVSLLDDGEELDLTNPPKVILVVGVNGAGKTTSISKIAKLLKKNSNSVMLAAGDTFRAAAADQLEIWSKRLDVPIIRQHEGSDPASVIYDAIRSSKSKDIDVLICDSAGRLHNKKNLMMELGKINKIINREYDREDIMTLLVLDSTTGQNALNQAVLFKEYSDIDGIILTKLDGTSKGGFVFSIKEKMDIPIYFVTLGEQVDDIEVFSAKGFVERVLD